MEATISNLFMLQKYISSKKNTLKPVDFNPVNTNSILDIHKCLIRKR